MIKTSELHYSRSWRDHLKTFDPTTETWLVADLRAKLEIQQILIREHGCVSEEAVLRASELWQKLFVKHKPEFKIVSNHCLQVQLSHWLSSEQEPWLKRPGVSQLLLAYIHQFLPVFVHPQGMSSMTNWLKGQDNAMVRWGKWLFVAHKYFEMFYQRRWVASTWLVDILSGQDDLQLLWPRQLKVDLGTQLSNVELSLLGRLQNVEVYTPKISSYHFLHKAWGAYSLLCAERSSSAKTFSLEAIPSADQKSNMRKFPTALAEVKDAVATLRTWLDQGLKPWDVAIVAPDIEHYWPVLSPYLQQEGIPCQKKSVTRLHSQSEVMHWLARMQIESGELTTGDLEQSLYGGRGQFATLHYDKFKQLFTNIYEASDIKRWRQAQDYFKLQLKPEQTWLRDEFIAWALQQWPQPQNTGALENVLGVLVADAPPTMTLHIKDWLNYLRSQCARIELTDNEAEAQGIFCENLPVARFLPVKKVYVLGLLEKHMSNSSVTSVSLDEVEAIGRDLGFQIQSPEVSQLDAELLWLMDQNYMDLTMSTSLTDFKGDPESPSVLWLTRALSGGRDNKLLDMAGESRWDQIQKTPEDKEVLEHIAVDLGETPPPLVAPPADLSLSVSRIERFENCPFVFMAESLFKLSDDQALDLDMDPLSKGSLDHAIFEELSAEPMNFDRSDEELEQVVEQCRKEQNIPISSKEHWRIVRRSHAERARKFLSFEKEWRQQFTKTKTVGRETWFEVAWDTEKSDFTKKDEGQNQLVFRGQIDRIDSDGDGHAVVMDYKSSATQTRNYTSWLNNSVQLGVYSYLIEKGLTELGPLEVWGAAYYVMKDFKRNKGLWRSDVESHLYEVVEKGRNVVSKEQQENFYGEIRERVSFLINKATEGDYAPNPKEQKNCYKCKWSQLCRAPHLS